MLGRRVQKIPTGTGFLEGMPSGFGFRLGRAIMLQQKLRAR